jgi:hypothetical protein
LETRLPAYTIIGNVEELRHKNRKKEETTSSGGSHKNKL